jgi:hypothetical protein
MDDPWTQAAQLRAGALNTPGVDLVMITPKPDLNYEEDQEVMVKFPLTQSQSDGDRASWPWVSGWITEVCGPDEWQVCVQDYSLALTEDGQVPLPGTPEEDLLFPCCFRDSSEIRTRS